MHYQSTMLQVVAFCDIDVKKINKGFYIYEESDVPYEWYIWRTLSLAVWEGKQISGRLVWWISSRSSLELIKTSDKTTVLAMILIWQSELNLPNRQIKITAKCTAYTVCIV